MYEQITLFRPKISAHLQCIPKTINLLNWQIRRKFLSSTPNLDGRGGHIDTILLIWDVNRADWKFGRHSKCGDSGESL